jgi:soluble lytic murein transglycosylase-like protein
MRFAAITLCVGCSVLACKFVAPPQLIQPASCAPSSEFPALRLAIDRLRFAFPHVELRPAAAPSATDAKPQVQQAASVSKSETLQLIASAAAKHNVPAAFVQSIVAAESNFNCAAISPRGAIGLMQLMPETAQQFGADPTIPAQNIDAGTRYLRWLMDRYQKRRSAIQHVIAAYNAGPAMVDRYHGIPPFRETRCYVARVLGFFKQFGGLRHSKAFRG